MDAAWARITGLASDEPTEPVRAKLIASTRKLKRRIDAIDARNQAQAALTDTSHNNLERLAM